MDKDDLTILLNAKKPLRAEKDLMECLILQNLFSDTDLRDNCILTGSGSITKSYNIGNRISKDIDLAWGDFDELSRTRSVKELNDFKDDFKEFVFEKMKYKIAEVVQPLGKFEILTDRDLRKKSVKYRLETGRRSSPELHLYYKSALGHRYTGHIAIEFIPRHYADEVIDLRCITPSAFDGKMVIQNIPTVHYSQTFWDKCYALHVISQLGAIRPGLAHHYYDVSCMSNFVNILHSTQCLTDVVVYQGVYTTRNVFQPSSVCEIQLVPNEKTIQELKQDYKTIRNSFKGPQEAWENVIGNIKALNNKIRHIGQ